MNSNPTKGQILIAEDHHVHLKGMEKCLLMAGWSVSTAMTGTRAKDMLNNYEFDLLVFDYKLPDCTTFQIKEWMNDNAIDLPMIVVTNYFSEALREQATKLGIARFEAKPVNITTFPTNVERVLYEFKSTRQKKSNNG